jgi:hypothetical protein
MCCSQSRHSACSALQHGSAQRVRRCAASGGRHFRRRCAARGLSQSFSADRSGVAHRAASAAAASLSPCSGRDRGRALRSATSADPRRGHSERGRALERFMTQERRLLGNCRARAPTEAIQARGPNRRRRREVVQQAAHRCTFPAAVERSSRYGSSVGAPSRHRPYRGRRLGPGRAGPAPAAASTEVA